MAKVSVDLDDGSEEPHDNEDTSRTLRDLAAALPSISRAKSSALKDAPRVQFSFTNVPKPIKEAFVAEAHRRKLTQKELLYLCLRAGGLEIPDTIDIDGRRR